MQLLQVGARQRQQGDRQRVEKARFVCLVDQPHAPRRRHAGRGARRELARVPAQRRLQILAQPCAQSAAGIGQQRLHVRAVLGHGVQVHVGAAPAQRLDGQLPLRELGEQGALLRLCRLEVERPQQEVGARRSGLLGKHLLMHPAVGCLGRCRPHPIVGAKQRQRLGGKIRRLAAGEGDQEVGNMTTQHAHAFTKSCERRW